MAGIESGGVGRRDTFKGVVRRSREASRRVGFETVRGVGGERRARRKSSRNGVRRADAGRAGRVVRGSTRSLASSVSLAQHPARARACRPRSARAAPRPALGRASRSRRRRRTPSRPSSASRARRTSTPGRSSRPRRWADRRTARARRRAQDRRAGSAPRATPGTRSDCARLRRRVQPPASKTCGGSFDSVLAACFVSRGASGGGQCHARDRDGVLRGVLRGLGADDDGEARGGGGGGRAASRAAAERRRRAGRRRRGGDDGVHRARGGMAARTPGFSEGRAATPFGCSLVETYVFHPPSVSTFDRAPFQRTDEHFLYSQIRLRSRRATRHDKKTHRFEAFQARLLPPKRRLLVRGAVLAPCDRRRGALGSRCPRGTRCRRERERATLATRRGRWSSRTTSGARPTGRPRPRPSSRGIGRDGRDEEPADALLDSIRFDSIRSVGGERTRVSDAYFDWRVTLHVSKRDVDTARKKEVLKKRRATRARGRAGSGQRACR